MNKTRQKYLLIRIQKYGDAQSFSELYEALVDPIYRFIYFKVNDKELAQDLTSEVFLKSWRQLTTKRTNEQPVKHLKAFIYVIARNRVIDYYRSAQKAKEIPITHQIEQLSGSEEKQEELMAKIDSGYVLNVIQQLKSSYQEILILRHVEELSLSEIAHLLQKTPVATRVMLHRANQALKREYEKTTPNN